MVALAGGVGLGVPIMLCHIGGLASSNGDGRRRQSFHPSARCRLMLSSLRPSDGNTPDDVGL